MSERIFVAAGVFGVLSIVPVIGTGLVGASWLVVAGSVPWWYTIERIAWRSALGLFVAALWMVVVGGLVKWWEVR